MKSRKLEILMELSKTTQSYETRGSQIYREEIHFYLMANPDPIYNQDISTCQQELGSTKTKRFASLCVHVYTCFKTFYR